MRFESPYGLLAFLLIIPILILARRIDATRAQQRERAAQLGFLDSSQLRARTDWLSLIGLGLLTLALSRPMLIAPTIRQNGVYIVVIDSSRSMAARDIQPDRLSVAKQVALKRIEGLPLGLPVGVVSFSSSGVVVQAPTTDRKEIEQGIQAIKPEGETALAEGMNAALSAIKAHGSEGPRAILLISDGLDTLSSDFQVAASELVSNGVRIDVVGVGTEEGIEVELPDGEVVHVWLNHNTLQAIARLGKGEYRHVREIDKANIGEAKLGFSLGVRLEEVEMTPLLSALGMLAVVFGGLPAIARWLGSAHRSGVGGSSS